MYSIMCVYMHHICIYNVYVYIFVVYFPLYFLCLFSALWFTCLMYIIFTVLHVNTLFQICISLASCTALCM